MLSDKGCTVIRPQNLNESTALALRRARPAGTRRGVAARGCAALTALLLLAGAVAASPLLPPATSDSGSAELKEALARLQAGEPASARRLVRTYLLDRPDDAAGHELLGHVQFQQGDLQGAEGSFERALELDPGRASALVRLAITQAATGRPALARQTLDRAVAAGATAQQTGDLETRLARDIRKREAAVRRVERTVEAGGREEIARRLHDVVDLHFSLQQQHRAVEILEQYARRYPKDRDLGVLLAETYATLGEPRRALAEIRRVVRVHPEAARARFFEAKVLWSLAEQHDALDAIERSLALDPRQVDAWIQLSEMHHAHEGHGADVHEHSREALERGLTANPHSPALLVVLAEMQREEDRLDEANATLRAMLDERPGNGVGLARLALNLAEDPAQRDEVRRLARAAAQAEPELTLVRHAVARSRQLDGEQAEAVEMLEPICYGPQRTGESCLHLAQGFASVGRRNDAAAAAREALALGLVGRSEDAARALAESSAAPG